MRAKAMPASLGEDGGHVSVRKIDNGYLICHSSDGTYRETFSKEKPEISVGSPSEAPKERSSMSEAVAHLNSRK